MKSYDVANAILNLWVKNCNKSSGEMNKEDLDIPIYVEAGDFIIPIKDVYYGFADNTLAIIIKTTAPTLSKVV